MGAIFIALTIVQPVQAQFVPGSGKPVPNAKDDFEDANWTWVSQGPKSSHNIDKQERTPGGYSNNGLWGESALRGEPDQIKRIKTPDGGLPESKASLLIRSLHTGIPGRITNQQQQDDLLMQVNKVVGGYIPVEWSPSMVVRVYVPEWQYFEQRNGSTFGIRADVIGSKTESQVTGNFFRRTTNGVKREAYWPGFFIAYNQATATEKAYAYILCRSDQNGHDVPGPVIREPGWWTFGMSFTGDGRVHYYASPGVDDLTAKDFITSQMPYGFKAEQYFTMFFNVVNQDDGRSWTTPWVIDDPTVYWRR